MRAMLDLAVCYGQDPMPIMDTPEEQPIEPDYARKMMDA